MNRFLTLPGVTATISGMLRRIGVVLGCTAMAGAVSLGAAASADAAAFAHPEPQRSLPPGCRHAMTTGDRYTTRECRQARQEMNEQSRRSGRDGGYHRRRDRQDRAHRPRRRPTPPLWLDELLRHWPTTRPEPRRTKPSTPRPQAATGRTPARKPTPTSSAEPRAEQSTKPTTAPSSPQTPQAVPTLSQAEDLDTPPPLQPFLLLGLLLPAVAAMCFPFRHRLYAASAGTPGFPVTEVTEPARVHPGYRTSLDPFSVPALGLTGPGAPAAARILAVTVLEAYGDTSLVVIPRPDTTVLFGLAEDELLDEDIAALFIPGNLDAALAYLETELVIRENTGVTNARRLLLVADPEDEADRIQALLERHPGNVTVLLLGTWTNAQVTVDDDGLVNAPPDLAVTLPERLPALSRTVARDRLFSSLTHHKEPRKTPSKRRPNSRRS